jgi:predicted CXXCH cytochrome family protein
MQAAPAAVLLLLAAPGLARAEPSCRACHEERFEATWPHLPAAAGLCGACHDVRPGHLEDGERALAMTLPESRTCLACHDGPARGRSRHAALDLEDGCVGCHDPHGGERRRHLRRAVPVLCAGCHATPAAAPAAPPGEAEPAPAGAPHAALAQGEACLGCHDPHAAPNARLLRRDPAATCLACHAQRVAGRGRRLAGIRWKVEETGGGHGVASWTGQRAGRNVGRECLACHLAHPREGGGLLAGPTVEALCFSCHDPKAFPEAAPGRRLHPGTRHPAGGGADPAKPGRPFTCVSCHDPHGSTQPALFRYRPIAGARAPADRCGHCHAAAMGLPRPAAPPPWNEQDARP